LAALPTYMVAPMVKPHSHAHPFPTPPLTHTQLGRGGAEKHDTEKVDTEKHRTSYVPGYGSLAGSFA
jgi:hypothetical protein